MGLVHEHWLAENIYIILSQGTVTIVQEGVIDSQLPTRQLTQTLADSMRPFRSISISVPFYESPT